MRSTASDVESYKSSLNEFNTQLQDTEYLIVEINNVLDSWLGRLHTVSQSIDSWTGSFNYFIESFWIIEYVINGLFIYVRLSRLALTLIGVTFRNLTK